MNRHLKFPSYSWVVKNVSSLMSRAQYNRLRNQNQFYARYKPVFRSQEPTFKHESFCEIDLGTRAKRLIFFDLGAPALPPHRRSWGGPKAAPHLRPAGTLGGGGTLGTPLIRFFCRFFPDEICQKTQSIIRVYAGCNTCHQ